MASISELRAKEYGIEKKAHEDKIYISLVKFLGGFLILVSTVILVYNNLSFTKYIIVMEIMGLVILAGGVMWDMDNKKNIQKLESKIESEERQEEEGVV